MLEVRYITATGALTAWCADQTQFGNLDRGREEELILILDLPVPPLPLDAYLIQNDSLKPNPDYAPSPEDAFLLRAQEILATSPQAITMPEIWELLRILGYLLGLSPPPS